MRICSFRAPNRRSNSGWFPTQDMSIFTKRRRPNTNHASWRSWTKCDVDWLPDLLPKPQRADAEEQHGHNRHDPERGPVFEEAGAAENDGAHQVDEIGGRE